MNDMADELFLAMESHNSSRRFKTRSEDEINRMIQNTKSKNTEKSTKWCLNIFDALCSVLLSNVLDT